MTSIVTRIKKDWKEILALASYDLWLLAFPLQGYFLLKVKNFGLFPYFIIPHAITFFIVAKYGYKINFYKISSIAGIITSILTAVFLFLPYTFKQYAFIVIGVTSSLLIIRIGCGLKNTQNPLISSAAGLILGNLFLGVLFVFDIPEKYLFILLGILLSIQALIKPYSSVKESLKEFLKYLPFIFSFYFLIGMFYVGLMPLYLKHCYLEGSELLFYILAIMISVKLFNIRKDLSLAAGIGSGIFAVAFLHYLSIFTINLSMYFVQMAAGFMDVFCFGFFLQEEDVLRRFALGAGCMLLGPTVGFPILILDKWNSLMVIAGNIILGIALVIFYFIFTFKKETSLHSTQVIQEQVSNLETFNENFNNTFERFGIPEGIFSQREKEVFLLIISGKSIKEIASILQISESSVKTYLQRIYKKLNISSKTELLQKFSFQKRRKIIKLKSKNKNSILKNS